MDNSINFVNSILYQNACEIVEDIRTSDDGTRNHIFRFREKQNHKIELQCGSEITRIGGDGKKENENVLGEILAIPTKGDKYMEDFFRTNGFLFPLTYSYEEIELGSIYKLINRIKDTVELINLIDGADEDDEDEKYRWGKMLSISLRMVKDDITFQYNKCMPNYRTPSSWPIYDRVSSEPLFSKELVWELYGYDHDDAEKEINEKKHSYPKENTIKKVWEDSIMTSLNENKEVASLLQEIVSLREKGDVSFFEEKIGADHVIRKVFSDRIYDDSIIREEFSDRMKDVIRKIAKHIICTEISHNLNNVWQLQPKDGNNNEDVSSWTSLLSYNAEQMCISVNITSLFQAIYFALAQYNPSEKKYRKCMDEKCGKYFLSPKTNTKKIYCSAKCGNRKRREETRMWKKEARGQKAKTD